MAIHLNADKEHVTIQFPTGKAGDRRQKELTHAQAHLRLRSFDVSLMGTPLPLIQLSMLEGMYCDDVGESLPRALCLVQAGVS